MRYLPQTQKSREEMLKVVGANSIDDLYVDVPKAAFIDGKADLPDHQGELQVERYLSAYANQNHAASDGPFFLGAGAYYHHVPATVDYIIQRSEFLTAYAIPAGNRARHIADDFRIPDFHRSANGTGNR